MINCLGLQQKEGTQEELPAPLQITTPHTSQQNKDKHFKNSSRSPREIYSIIGHNHDMRHTVIVCGYASKGSDSIIGLATVADDCALLFTQKGGGQW